MQDFIEVPVSAGPRCSLSTLRGHGREGPSDDRISLAIVVIGIHICNRSLAHLCETLPVFDNSDIDQWETTFVERRSICRTKIQKGALLFFRGKTGVYSCTVCDVTNLGAGISSRDLQIMPLDFELSFDGFRTVRNCKLIWRQGDFLGVAFVN
jgi:hypothetical protein